jgi:hypothetical protein
MRAGFFAYPWDLLEEGPEDAVRTMVSRYRCNAIALNANYHHARLLRPRARGPKTLQLPGAVAAFEPQPGCYDASGLMPVADPRLASSQILTRVREACASQGVDFGLWTVGLHNSTLGENHPHLCVHNCFDDIYTYALCPAKAEVRAYLRGLVQDLCLQFRPQRIILEAVGYLGLRHWVHHELFMVEWDESLEMLLSLCFCPACLEWARRANVDAEILRQRVSGWAKQLLHEERGSLSLDFSQGEVASLLLEIPDLWSYLCLRAETVTRMVADLHTLAQAHQIALEVIPASFHRPVSRAWLEGASLPGLGQACDGLVVLAYFENASEVAADLRWTSSLVPDVAIVAGLNACASSARDGASLVAQSLACKSAGCTAVYFYNYGLLTQRRLDWVAQANASILEGDVETS